MNTVSDDSDHPIFRGRTPENFRTRRRDSWRDGEPMPPHQLDYVMVRLWDGKRSYYSVSAAEIEAFCHWLEWHHTSGTRLVAVVVRGVRCIHVARLPKFFRDHLPPKRHSGTDELPKLIKHLTKEFGEKSAQTILRDFF